MIAIDLRSIILMAGVMSLLLSVVLLFLRLSFPKSIKGLGLWAAAPAVIFVSTLLFGARGVLPDHFSVILANLLLLGGVSLFFLGSQRFFGLKPSYGYLAGAILVMVPLLWWFTLVEPSYLPRLRLVTLLWASIALGHALLIWRHGKKVFAVRFTMVVELSKSAVIFARFLSSWLAQPEASLFDATHLQTFFIASSAFISLALGIGLILMAGDRLRDEFEHAAFHDSLTNALNRRALIAACEQELQRCRRHGRSMALLMMDLDHFKAINDSHGHQTGDRVLVDFVARVMPLLRLPDQLGRFGGEEFMVLLPETTQEEAQTVAERIRARVAACVEGLPAVTVSMGVTSSHPDDVQFDELLARADKALYKAKAAGRNCVAVA